MARSSMVGEIDSLSKSTIFDSFIDIQMLNPRLVVVIWHWCLKSPCWYVGSV